MIKFFNNSLKKTLSFHQKLLFQGADFVFSALIFLLLRARAFSACAQNLDLI